MEGGAVEWENSLDSGQILWGEHTRFLGRLDVGVREREKSRIIPRCLA